MELTRIRVKGPNVLVLPDGVDEQTSGGLWIPKTALEGQLKAAYTGVVVGVGAMAWQDEVEPRCKIGDRIAFVKYGGTVLACDRVQYRLLSDLDVLAVIDNDVETEPLFRKPIYMANEERGDYKPPFEEGLAV